jgi:hypothetical protein
MSIRLGVFFNKNIFCVCINIISGSRVKPDDLETTCWHASCLHVDRIWIWRPVDECKVFGLIILRGLQTREQCSSLDVRLYDCQWLGADVVKGIDLSGDDECIVYQEAVCLFIYFFFFFLLRQVPACQRHIMATAHKQKDIVACKVQNTCHTK